MNRSFFFVSLLTGCLFFITPSLSAQNTDNPGEYITSIYKARGDMDNKYMQYLSATSHTHRARKLEKLRQEELNNITESPYKTTDLPLNNSPNSLPTLILN